MLVAERLAELVGGALRDAVGEHLPAHHARHLADHAALLGGLGLAALDGHALPLLVEAAAFLGEVPGRAVVFELARAVAGLAELALQGLEVRAAEAVPSALEGVEDAQLLRGDHAVDHGVAGGRDPLQDREDEGPRRLVGRVAALQREGRANHAVRGLALAEHGAEGLRLLVLVVAHPGGERRAGAEIHLVGPDDGALLAVEGAVARRHLELPVEHLAAVIDAAAQLGNPGEARRRRQRVQSGAVERELPAVRHVVGAVRLRGHVLLVEGRIERHHAEDDRIPDREPLDLGDRPQHVEALALRHLHGVLRELRLRDHALGQAVVSRLDRSRGGGTAAPALVRLAAAAGLLGSRPRLLPLAGRALLASTTTALPAAVVLLTFAPALAGEVAAVLVGLAHGRAPVLVGSVSVRWRSARSRRRSR